MTGQQDIASVDPGQGPRSSPAPAEGWPGAAATAGWGRREVLRQLGVWTVAGWTLPVLAACGDSPPQLPRLGPDIEAAIGEAITGKQVPVGHAKFFPDAAVVLTHPSAGHYVVLSSTCTHQRARISRLVDGKLACPLHGSRFDPATGEPVAGPAQEALPHAEVTVSGDSVRIG